MPVLLWTDLLFFALLAGAAVYAFHARRHEQLRAPWRQVVRRPAAMGSAVVLGAYVLISVLDSLHYHPRLPAAAEIAQASGAETVQAQRDPAGSGGERPRAYSAEIVSVFDRLVAVLREAQEKSYSAPFATHLLAREPVPGPDGTVVRIRPRLVHGGAHLAEADLSEWSARGMDIARTVARGALEGLAGGAALVLLVAAGTRRGAGLGTALGRILGGRSTVPWRTVFATATVLLVLAAAAARLAAGYHVLGTDKVGQDVLYQALKSVRTGLLIGTLTTLVMLPFALLMGTAAGYFRGWVDDAIQYLYTTLNSIPGVLLIAAAIIMMQVYMAGHAEDFATVTERADLRLLFLCLILGITSWTGLCRLLRGEVLKLREIEYVQAAVAFGVGHAGIMGRHILPNVMHIVLITLVLDFSALVLAEAVLSYINIGVDPTTPSWGNMINGARLELAREPVVWWSLGASLLFMFVLVLAANLFADAVRDAFDPRLRRGAGLGTA